ncbi:hypothetical protein NEIMUCOT_05698 [Neisseria mucosa ATCC 25996]|uniref:Uncharacterized protein n=1 Tax=Neisseria mucosa (strain ATCC 25996 / DSM 4631 / NCTC 10774 / M26) TaxID=546266 RepID=D2ZYI7_NEIM2|nr:hypothetical protein NEIMUCOT_05698 [Neisseria mucosa ATCC 25996]
MPCLAVLSVLSAASSPCPDLNLIHYKRQFAMNRHFYQIRKTKRG